MINETETMIKARYPAIMIVSHEETRVIGALSMVAMEARASCVRWTITRGFQVIGGSVALPKAQKPVEALQALEKVDAPLIAILPDFGAFTTDPVIVRALRDCVEAFRTGDHARTIVLLGASAKVPTEIERYTAIVDWSLPTRDDIRLLAERASESGGSADALDAIVDSAIGLTEIETENAFAKSLAACGRLDPLVIQSEKKQIIRKSGLLEYVDTDALLEGIGGLAGLKSWLKQRRHAFSTEARDAGLLPPKGAIVVGPPGTGKSLVAKATGAAWKLPLLKLDLGKIYQGLVGSSEENMRKVLATVEAVAPCVLWIDEIEKSFAGSNGGGDSGTSARVFGTFLTWMQEKKASVFVIATANDITGLPPELLRKGRFDEIFFVDLPTEDERKVIYQIHLTHVLNRIRGQGATRGASDFDVSYLARVSEGFSGSEIEAAINEALYAAFDAGEPLSTAHIDAARAATVPLSRSMEARIEAVRAWALTNARSAAKVADTKRAPKGRFN